MAGLNSATHAHGLQPIRLDQMWDDLRAGIEDVYQRKSMTRPRYVELYTYLLFDHDAKLIL